MTDIQGQRALITGGASGIGRLLATELGKAGARLVLWDIDEAGLQRAHGKLLESGFEVNVSLLFNHPTSPTSLDSTNDRRLSSQLPLFLMRLRVSTRDVARHNVAWRQSSQPQAGAPDV